VFAISGIYPAIKCGSCKQRRKRKLMAFGAIIKWVARTSVYLLIRIFVELRPLLDEQIMVPYQKKQVFDHSIKASVDTDLSIVSSYLYINILINIL